MGFVYPHLCRNRVVRENLRIPWPFRNRNVAVEGWGIFLKLCVVFLPLNVAVRDWGAFDKLSNMHFSLKLYSDTPINRLSRGLTIGGNFFQEKLKTGLPCPSTVKRFAWSPAPWKLNSRPMGYGLARIWARQRYGETPGQEREREQRQTDIGSTGSSAQYQTYLVVTRTFRLLLRKSPLEIFAKEKAVLVFKSSKALEIQNDFNGKIYSAFVRQEGSFFLFYRFCFTKIFLTLFNPCT